MKIADLTLDINPQAWAVLHMLAEFEVESELPIRFSTAPWYNGRERGFVVSATNFSRKGKTLHVAFFKHRNSDNICALRWEGSSGMNPPTIESDGAKAYPTDNKFADIAHEVEYGEAGKMASWVFKQFQEWANGKHAAAR